MLPFSVSVFPARAGVILEELITFISIKSLSRTSGGVSRMTTFWDRTMGVFPARAGVVVSPSEVIPLVCKSFPHERG